MLRDGRPYFLDYQGGRKGALQYDIASLLYDGKADLPPELRQQLLDHYIDRLAPFAVVTRDEFMEHYYAYVYVRILQALGAYGFRGFYERKTHFLQSVPYALKNLRWLAHNVQLPIALPALMDAFNSMLASDELLKIASSAENLKVRIFSFSFHRQAPVDESGNGGGFVFDGRSLPNPGREEQFPALTGKDAEVADYLNRQESVHRFLLQRVVTRRREREELQAPRLQRPDGLVRMHRRPASFCLSSRAVSEASARNRRSRCRRSPHRVGEDGQMKAMVLAAGLGTRLRPLTDDRPKALVTLAGRTLLQITLERLRTFGVHDVIINAHHHADKLIAYLAANQNFGMHIEISREETLLDTGGGLKQAQSFFLRDAQGTCDSFFLHNVDVLSSIDLSAMAQAHAKSGALATLAVMNRPTSRPLLFDKEGQFIGRAATSTDSETSDASEAHNQALAFCGIHVVSTRIFSKLTEEGAFSIIDAYIRLAAAGERILAYRADHSYWRDLGRPEHIEQATRDIASGHIQGFEGYGLQPVR